MELSHWNAMIPCYYKPGDTLFYSIEQVELTTSLEVIVPDELLAAWARFAAGYFSVMNYCGLSAIVERLSEEWVSRYESQNKAWHAAHISIMILHEALRPSATVLQQRWTMARPGDSSLPLSPLLAWAWKEATFFYERDFHPLVRSAHALVLSPSAMQEDSVRVRGAIIEYTDQLEIQVQPHHTVIAGADSPGFWPGTDEPS